MHLHLDLDDLRSQTEHAEDGILDGRILKRALLDQLSLATDLLARDHDLTPKLAVVQVGEDPASTVYVRHKIRACAKVGIDSLKFHMPVDTTATQLHERLTELNNDPSVHGILVQMPLPDHLDPHQGIMLVHPSKDVDGFHPHNLGHLMAWQGTLEPCTPRGVMTMLRAYGVEPRGLDAVVVGRSMTVGRPMAQMLMRADATVTVCHRHTRDLASKIRCADLVVVATGVADLVKGAWIKEGAIVVDIGITRTQEGTLTGDVEFDAARERACLITPVPGGVGQMTVATLMENTIRAACRSRDIVLDLRGA